MLTLVQLRALTWAVSQAEAWRGSLVGDPDPDTLEAFDLTVTRAKDALKALRLERKAKKRKPS